MASVIGIDPGGTTGVATVLYYPDSGWLGVPRQFEQSVARHEIVDAVSRLEPDAVAIERFVVGRRSGRVRDAKASEFARDLIGAVRALDTIPVIDYRTAAEVKRWATDRRLDAAGLLSATKGAPHARDAARHALFCLVKRGWAPDPLSIVDRH